MIPIVVPATPAHMAELQAGLREADKVEVIGMGSTVEESFRVTWRRSLLTQTVLVDGRVAAVGGVGGSALGGVGQPWMLTTSLFERIPVFMVKEGLRQVDSWLAIFSRLESLVDARYGRACGFLEVIGFRLDGPVMIPAGIAVRRFWMER